MKYASAGFVLVLVLGSLGCGGSSGTAAKAKHDDHEHHLDVALTEKDVKLPDSFKAGAGRLQELQQELSKFLQQGDLEKAHRQAEEMALVAKKMKELARDGLPEDKQPAAGRLCNQLTNDYRKLDEAIHAGKKQELADLNQKMGKTIDELKDLVK